MLQSGIDNGYFGEEKCISCINLTVLNNDHASGLPNVQGLHLPTPGIENRPKVASVPHSLNCMYNVCVLFFLFSFSASANKRVYI